MLTTIALALLLGATPKVGDVAPDFTVTDTDGKSHTLSVMVQQGSVVLAFFPKAFTPGCTRELKTYGSRYDELQKRRAQVLAISMDDVITQKDFKASLGATFPFIADPEGKLVKLYDVKGLFGASRATFVVGKDRKIVHVDSGSDAIDPSKAVGACTAP